jgi:preprotein translocase subunit SecF
MELIKPDINLDFVGKRRIAYAISAVMILISIASLVAHGGPRYGIDFAGGTVIQIKFQGPVEIAKVKDSLAAANMAGASIQRFGDAHFNEFLIRAEGSIETQGEFADALQKAAAEATGTGAEVRRIEMVGPQVGQDLREKALLAIFFSLLFIAIYISGRFEFKWLISGVMAAALAGAVYLLSLFHVGIPLLIVAALIITLALFYFLDLKYAMGAIVALLHDVVITVGLFSLFDKEFSLPIIAALLTIIGYSLNDTIIVYDRIRENLRRYHKNPLLFIINRSVNETLSRTVLTAGTTLLTVVALFSLGGGIIHDFAFAMLVGVAVGTYSSVYIASPILLAWQKR